MELLSRKLVDTGTSLTFSSAGTHAVDGLAMDASMSGTLAGRGVPGAGSFRSRRFRTEHLLHADLVLTAETAHRQFILDDHAGAFRKVFTLGQFADSVRAVDSDLIGRELLAAVARRRTGTDAALDVPDPIGKGEEVAEQVAAAVEGLLRVVLPALTGSRKITS